MRDSDVIVIGAGHNGLASDHFAAMQGATNGDFTHGLIHPDPMLAARATSEGSAHATLVPGLYLCGAACHPGPGVTFLPGYNCAHEVIRMDLS